MDLQNLGGLCLGDKLGQFLLETRHQKIRNRNPTLVDKRRVDPVGGGFEHAAGEVRKLPAKVDDEGSGEDGGVDPAAVVELDLEAGLVLDEEGEEASVL